MVVSRQFRLINAIHAVSDDGVHVEFINAYQVAYFDDYRSIKLDAERYIASDGAPDGRVVSIVDRPRWSDGATLTDEEFAQIMADLQAAAIPLQSKFRLATSA